MVWIVLALCAAEVLGMAGAFAFPALVPAFQQEWRLSNTETGWISGVYFAGYAASVPILTAATDRIDAKRVWLGSTAVTVLSMTAFALVAQGFWSALVLRALAGVGLAGTYMPGLKALVDRTSGPMQPRWISWYTASFSLGTSLSFLAAGVAADAFDWRGAFWLAAASAAIAFLLVAAVVPKVTPAPQAEPTPLFQFRPVLANRPVMGYILAYSAHTWELFGLRSWMVAFLAVAAAAQASDQGLSPSHVATIASLLAMAASIAGAELAVRFERRLVCGLAALSSAMLAGIMGFFVQAPYQVVVALVLLHNILVQLDSAALTTGAVLETHSNRRGATIGLHSLLGFGAAFVGPLAFGMVLDLAASFGPMTAWGLAFATLAGVACLAPLALWRMRR